MPTFLGWLTSGLNFCLQCFNTILESAFESQVTKSKEVTMEPLAQGLQEDLVSAFHPSRVHYTKIVTHETVVN